MSVAVDRTRAGFQLSREARVQAREVLISRFAQVEIGESPPDGDRGSRQQRRLDLAEPAKQPIRHLTRDAVRQQKADVLRENGFGGCRSHCHITVKIFE
jgi:hypothetical protein